MRFKIYFSNSIIIKGNFFILNQLPFSLHFEITFIKIIYRYKKKIYFKTKSMIKILIES